MKGLTEEDITALLQSLRFTAALQHEQTQDVLLELLGEYPDAVVKALDAMGPDSSTVPVYKYLVVRMCVKRVQGGDWKGFDSLLAKVPSRHKIFLIGLKTVAQQGGLDPEMLEEANEATDALYRDVADTKDPATLEFLSHALQGMSQASPKKRDVSTPKRLNQTKASPVSLSKQFRREPEKKKRGRGRPHKQDVTEEKKETPQKQVSGRPPKKERSPVQEKKARKKESSPVFRPTIAASRPPRQKTKPTRFMEEQGKAMMQKQRRRTKTIESSESESSSSASSSTSAPVQSPEATSDATSESGDSLTELDSSIYAGWSKSEVNKLRRAVQKHGMRWSLIIDQYGFDRSSSEVRTKWRQIKEALQH